MENNMSRPPSIWISNRNPIKDEVVHVRTMIRHPMEAGIRHDAAGKSISRNIVNTFTCHLNDVLLFEWLPETPVAQNPYLDFKFVARSSGVLRMRWQDDTGEIIEVTEAITLA